MTPERWRAVDSVVQAALAHAPGERPAFLADVCADDAALRAEAESLLAGDVGDDFLEQPAAAARDPRDTACARLSAALAGRYEVEREVGRGGMATVYLARDLRHKRSVALKVLHPEVGALVEPARFRREIETAAGLSHPHILPLYDSGGVGGLLYFAMPYVAGASLRERLRREGRLAVSDALRVVREVAAALDCAHRHGVVHRDVKPENILLGEDGDALVADFGVARARGRELAPAAGEGAPDNGQGSADAAIAGAGDGREPLTERGQVIGTPAYMSPEQAFGRRDLDGRSDEYSLACVAFELLAGEAPFTGPSDEQLARRPTQAPPSLAALRPDLAPAAAVIARALAPDPRARYATAAAFADALTHALTNAGGRQGAGMTAPADAPTPGAPRPGRRARTWLAAGALLAGLGAGGWRVWPRTLPRAAPGVRERVLVADFANLTRDSTFGDLVAHALRSEIAQSPVLTVAGRQTIAETLGRMRLAPDTRLTGELAREVAVREDIKAVVEGEVRAVGAGLVLSAAVVDATSGDVIHGATETARDSTQVLAAIGRLADGVRRGVGESVASVQAGDPLFHVTTSSLPALRKFMAGMRAYWRGEYRGAAELLDEAVALDPGFAQAHLMRWAALRATGSEGGAVLRSLVRLYELRSLLTEQERYAVEGHYHLTVTGDLPMAVAAFRKHIEALRRYPAGEGAWYASFGVALELTGDLAGAEAVLREARVRFPTVGNQTGLVRVLHAQGKDAQAQQILDEVSRRYPDHPGVLEARARLLALAGRYEDAHALASRSRRDAGLLNGLRLQAETDAARGRMGEAVGHLRELRDQMLARGDLPAALEVAAAGGRLRFLAGDLAGMSEVDALLARYRVDSLDVLSRPYLPLVLAYATAGRPRDARSMLAAYERESPPEFQGPDRWMRHRARGAVYHAEGSPTRALAELRRAARVPAARVGLFDDRFSRPDGHPELARAYDALGVSDSAIVVYERYLASRALDRTTVDAFELGSVLERLGALYEHRGNRVRAAAHYRRFAALWHDADPALQPRVEAARRRAAALAPGLPSL
jgi:tetratricopeptide (TPR) repeat protein/TolB-like protein